MTRLSNDMLSTLPSNVAVANYDRLARRGVVHLGSGAFHRGHQAAYFDDLMAKGHAGWMITGASLRSDKMAKNLNPQDGLFIHVTNQSATEGAADDVPPRHNKDYRLIRSLAEIIVASAEPQKLINALADQDTQLITLTVTEKGYGINAVTGKLGQDDVDIAYDIENPSVPRTTIGFLVAGLAARFDSGGGGVTILSCDNLPHNGKLTQSAVLQMAAFHSADLVAWIKENVAFPSSMVDRIVPAIQPEHSETLKQDLGIIDQGLVQTEPFSQWVIEDWFAGERPALEEVGVQFVPDVAAWEKAKLRLLNGAHSALAYLGRLAGYKFVHQAMAAPGMAAFINRLWDESVATLGEIEGFNAPIYRADLLNRFQNAALEHQTYQIAMDGSQKLPQRLLAPLEERYALNLSSPFLVAAIASWIKWQFATDDLGKAFIVQDPMAEKLSEIVQQESEDVEKYIRRIVSIKEIFSDNLSQNSRFIKDVTAAFEICRKEGALKLIAETLK